MHDPQVTPVNFYNRMRVDLAMGRGFKASTGAPPAPVWRDYILDSLDEFEEVVVLPINVAASKGTLNGLSAAVEDIPDALRTKIHWGKQGYGFVSMQVGKTRSIGVNKVTGFA